MSDFSFVSLDNRNYEFSAEQGSRRRQKLGSNRAVQVARAADYRRATRFVSRMVPIELAHVKVAAIIRRNIRHTQVRRGLASRLNYFLSI